MTLFGIDVSDAQGAIDWSKVKGAGIAFGIAKATEGNGYTSKTYAANAAGMKAAGLVPGAYHFLTGTPDGATQADYFLSKIGEPAGLLIGLDVETEPNLTVQPGIQQVQEFASRFAALQPGHPLLVYSGAWYWAGRDHMMDPRGADLGPLWASVYATAYGTPAAIYATVPASFWSDTFGGWPTITLLQFSPHTTVAGVAGVVDASAFRGTLAELRVLTGAPVIPDTSTGGPGPVITGGWSWIFDKRSTLLDGTGFRADADPALPQLAAFPKGTAIVPIALVTGADGKAWYITALYSNGYKIGAVPASKCSALTDVPADCSAAVTAATAPLKQQLNAVQGTSADQARRIAAAKAALG